MIPAPTGNRLAALDAYARQPGSSQMNARTLVLMIALLSIAATADSVRSVSIIGDTLRVTLTGGPVLDAVASADNMVECCYRTASARGPRTEVIGPAYHPSSHFSSVQTTGDPIVAVGPGYRIEVTRTDFTIGFFDAAGTLLFRTRGGAEGFWEDGSTKKVQANVVKGPYYGIQNKSTQLNQWYGVASLDAGDQGRAGGPFVWTTQGFGFLADNGAGALNFWDNNASTCYLQLEKPGSDGTRLFFLMAGAPAEIMRDYHLVTGFPPMPPLWALGFLHSEWGQVQSTIKARARTYRSKDIPADAFILDFDWLDWGNPDGEFKWNQTYFPGGMNGTLRDTMNAAGFKLMGIRKPRVHTGTRRAGLSTSLRTTSAARRSGISTSTSPRRGSGSGRSSSTHPTTPTNAVSSPTGTTKAAMAISRTFTGSRANTRVSVP
jgi:hypothetical protein